MKTLFNKIRKENTNLSSLICFIKCLRIKKFNKGEKKRYFLELVSQNDYCKENKKEVLEFVINCA